MEKEMILTSIVILSLVGVGTFATHQFISPERISNENEYNFSKGPQLNISMNKLSSEIVSQ